VLVRHEKNPLIYTRDIKPSTDDYEVVGAFNPGATMYNGEVLLLLRVAERCHAQEGKARVPIYEFNGGNPKPTVLEFDLNDPDVNADDSRAILYKGLYYLSSLSHLRMARSKDGINFEIDDKPTLYPACPEEAYGLEDARITKIGDDYYINFTVVSVQGWSTSLVHTKDFKNYERLGIIFPGQNKDVAIFPEKVNGKYYAFHRPHNTGLGNPSIWIAESPDLIHWGKHKCIMTTRENNWECEKIGGGAPPIRTKDGWLEIYHGSGPGGYGLFGVLLDLEDPTKIIKRTKEPLFVPEMDYETQGFFDKVVFTNGMVEKDDKLYIYYGAADDTTCLATTTIDEVLASF
jgi:predicted GH43/DUF377 family glycosyl hydrolase